MAESVKVTIPGVNVVPNAAGEDKAQYKVSVVRGTEDPVVVIRSDEQFDAFYMKLVSFFCKRTNLEIPNSYPTGEQVIVEPLLTLRKAQFEKFMEECAGIPEVLAGEEFNEFVRPNEDDLERERKKKEEEEETAQAALAKPLSAKERKALEKEEKKKKMLAAKEEKERIAREKKERMMKEKREAQEKLKKLKEEKLQKAKEEKERKDKEREAKAKAAAVANAATNNASAPSSPSSNDSESTSAATSIPASGSAENQQPQSEEEDESDADLVLSDSEPEGDPTPESEPEYSPIPELPNRDEIVAAKSAEFPPTTRDGHPNVFEAGMEPYRISAEYPIPNPPTEGACLHKGEVVVVKEKDDESGWWMAWSPREGLIWLPRDFCALCSSVDVYGRVNSDWSGGDGQLSVVAGQSVRVSIDEGDGWSCVVLDKKVEGWIPTAFYELDTRGVATEKLVEEFPEVSADVSEKIAAFVAQGLIDSGGVPQETLDEIDREIESKEAERQAIIDGNATKKQEWEKSVQEAKEAKITRASLHLKKKERIAKAKAFREARIIREKEEKERREKEEAEAAAAKAAKEKEEAEAEAEAAAQAAKEEEEEAVASSNSIAASESESAAGASESVIASTTTTSTVSESASSTPSSPVTSPSLSPSAATHAANPSPSPVFLSSSDPADPDDELRYCEVLYDFKEDEGTRLSVSKGQLVQVATDVKGVWTYAFDGEKEGWIPTNFVRVFHPLGARNPAAFKLPDGKLYKCIASYNAQSDSCISVAVGVKVRVKERTDRGWMFGSVDGSSGKAGWFPADFVQLG